MRGLLVASLLCLMCLCLSQSYSDQDRFGKSSQEVVALGHSQWVAWYCDPIRAGANGRVDAEKIYCVALYMRNQSLLEKQTAADRKFYDDCQILFANACKSAFTVGTSIHYFWTGWSLEIAQSSTSINQTIGELLVEPAEVKLIKKADVLAEYEKGKKLIGSLEGDNQYVNYAKREFPRMTHLIESADKLVKGRSGSQQALTWRLMLGFVKLVTTKRTG
ncbi:MAG: hypothetical protein H7Y17_01885 [Chlorobia bacterium]|nr:hypothetical protein [Fimbriimonadaceae bacterium]